MSIDLSLGVLVNVTVAERGESPLFYDHVEGQLEAVNALLVGNGLPEHREPRALAGVVLPGWTLTSGLYPFRDYADARGTDMGLDFSHVLACGHESFGLFIPVLFDDVLEPPQGSSLESAVGSSYRLFDECRTLARLLGILEDIEDDPPGAVARAIDEALGPSGRRQDRVDLPVIRDEVPDAGWPVGADGCSKLYWAAKLSVQYRVAIVIH